jgi:hypothetical protein
LARVLAQSGYTVETVEGTRDHRPLPAGGAAVVSIGTAADGPPFVEPLAGRPARAEAFALVVRGDRSATVAGADAAGALYGCLELAERIEAAGGRMPPACRLWDAPRLRLRGPCLGLQRPEPGLDGSRYDYCYLPQTFPWFYDRRLWTDFLDLLARHRFNAIYLWNGHPFTSILRLAMYPEAQEVPAPQLEANMRLFRWLTAEADRRNIWVVQNCYNIHVSHAFARSHRIPFAHSRPTPLVSAYMSRCFREFVETYPHVGLMLCLGEALDDRYDADWFTGVVLPAVRAGLRGGQALPPVVVRSHSTPIFEVLRKAKPIYPNLYVEAKYNNETLASDQVGGGEDPATTRHYAFEAGGQGHRRLAREAFLVTNVHCVANLEPFRWGSPDFVRRACASCVRTGVQGLHVYPLRYWEWPYTADRVEPRLVQVERDWIWFAAWARYAWNPDRSGPAEDQFWTGQLAARYGSPEAGRLMLVAYQKSGEVLPECARSFAVSSENYLADTLGQTLPQLFASRRWYGPPGETVADYAARQSAGRPHGARQPLAAAEEMAANANAALAAGRRALPLALRNRAEAERFAADLEAIRLVAHFYRHKVGAAVAGLVFLRTREPAQLDCCTAELARSVAVYRRLAELTRRTYLDCAGRHDPGRCYPYPAPKYLVWSDVLPQFESELRLVEANAAALRRRFERLRGGPLSESIFSKPLDPSAGLSQ